MVASLAAAKLPPLSDDAAATAKAAWSDKVAVYQLRNSQDKVAAQHLKAKGPDANPPLVAVPCEKSAPYVSAAVASGVISTMKASGSTADTTVAPKK